MPSSENLRKVYETQAERLTEQIEKAKLDSKTTHSILNVGTAFVKGMKYFRNPLDTWKNSVLKERQILQNLVFGKPLVYSRKKGFGTANFSLFYRILSRSEMSKSDLVDQISKSWNQIQEDLNRLL